MMSSQTTTALTTEAAQAQVLTDAEQTTRQGGLHVDLEDSMSVEELRSLEKRIAAKRKAAVAMKDEDGAKKKAKDRERIVDWREKQIRSHRDNIASRYESLVKLEAKQSKEVPNFARWHLTLVPASDPCHEPIGEDRALCSDHARSTSQADQTATAASEGVDESHDESEPESTTAL